MDKCSASATFVAKYLKDQNASTDEETEDHEDLELLECGDFDPFMASYRKCKKELTAQEKHKILFQALCKIRENPIMVDIIRKMFDFDLEVSELDNNLFSVTEKIEVIFNFMDIFFQL